MRSRLALLAVPLLASLPLWASPAQADDTMTYTATLHEENDSGASGTIKIWLTSSGDELKITMKGWDLLAGSPHAQHIHGFIDSSKESTCPGEAMDTNDDGIVTTSEGAPAYGAILVSLTTKGDTSPAAALAVADMPVADSAGSFSYSRTITVDSDIAENLGRFAVVSHGIDHNHNGKYDTSIGKSELDPSLPQEATAPAMCGAISMMASGGVSTGAGSTAGLEHRGELAVGGTLLAGALALLTVAARRRRGATD